VILFIFIVNCLLLVSVQSWSPHSDFPLFFPYEKKTQQNGAERMKTKEHDKVNGINEAPERGVVFIRETEGEI